MKTLILLLVPALALVACGGEKSPDQEGESQAGEAPEEHGHEAKWGGDLIVLGDHEGFLEVKLNHDAGMLAVWVYMGEEMKPASLDKAPILNLKTAAGPMQLTGEGEDDEWTFTDECLKGEPESARFRITVEGKSYSPEWGHQHEGHKEHEDD